MHRFLLTRKSIALSVLLLILILGIITTLSAISQQQDIRQHADGETWTEIGTHPQAANLNSPGYSNNLFTIYPWEGKIYAGYGDYQDNRGPVAIEGFDPVQKTFTVESIFDTEAVYRYRQVLGRLMAPSTDPIGAPIPLDIKLEDGTWIQPEILYTTHTYDVGTYNNSDVWLVGSSGYDAVAWRSIDGGVTWQQVMKENVGPNTVNRYYHMTVINNKLYIQNARSSTSKIFDGTSWTDGPNITTYGTRQAYFANKAIYFSSESSGSIRIFDGTTITTPVTGTFYAVVPYGNFLYALSSTDIKRTSDLVTWTTFASPLPTNARRMAITNGKLYVTATSKIYEYSSPISTLPSVRLRSTQPEILETNGSGTITAERTGDTTQQLTISYDILGTATNGTDYQSLPGTLTIPAGAATAAIPITTITDVAVEGNETVVLRLKNTATYNADLPSEGFVTIYEKPPVSITISKDRISENDEQALFTIKRGGSAAQPLTVNLSISGTSTNGTDYVSIPSTLIIPQNASTATITLTPSDDAFEEDNETVQINVIKTTNYSVILPFQTKLTIVDNDISSNPNIILNSSFEQLDGGGKPLNWSIAAANVDKTVARTGQNSIKIIGPSSYNYFIQGINPTPGKTYLISAWIKSQEAYGRGGGFRYVQSASSSAIQEAPWLRGTNEWTHVVLKQPVRSDFTAGRLDLWTALNLNEAVWFDDIRMVEFGATSPTPTPTPTPTLAPTIIPTATQTLTPTPTLPLPTATIPPTNTPIPSPTPGTGRKLQFSTKLEFIGTPGNPSPLNPTRTLLLELFSQPTSPPLGTASGTMTYNSNSGYFETVISIPTLADGSYLVRIKTPRYFKALLPGFVTFDATNTNAQIPLALSTLYVGDITGDDSADILDYNVLVDCYSDLLPPKACDDSSKKTSADLDDDGRVGGIDINLFLRSIRTRTGG